MNIPAGITHPAVTEAATHHAKMVTELNAARGAFKAAERRRGRAVEGDRIAYAKALAVGEKDPGERATAKADADIHEARRKVAALDTATSLANAATTEAVQTHAADIVTTLQDGLTTADRDWTDAIDRLQAAGQARGRQLSALSWLTRGEFQRPAPVVGGMVPGVVPRRKGQTPAMLPEVVQALREVIDPPADETVPQAVGGSMATLLGVNPDDAA